MLFCLIATLSDRIEIDTVDIKTMTTPLDTPWKDILEAYFPQCLEFFFPDAHAQIDWERGFEFLDGEL